jgi:hypothetical protein
MQRLLHDELCRAIELDHTQLETASLDEVVALQASVKVRRALLAFIHQHDTQEITKGYARRSTTTDE